MKFFEKCFLAAMIMLFFCINLFSQPPDTLWTRVYGGAHDDCAYAVIETSDSGYVAVGWTRSFGAGNSDAYLLKLNTNGDTMWTKTYGGPLDDEGKSVQQTSDGGFIIAGWTESFGAGKSDIYLLKTDVNGDIIWTMTYGGGSYDYAYSTQETSDSGYVIVGRTYLYGSFDVYLIKTNSNGSILWQKTYGGVGWDAGCSVQETAEIFGRYIIAGLTASNGEGWDIYLIKTYADGDTIWTKTYGGTDWDVGYEVHQTSDGGYIITGLTESFGAGSFDIYLIKTDSLGNILWTKTYGGTSWDEAYSVQETPGGGFIIVGTTESYGAGGLDVYLIRTDANGDSLWAKTYGGTDCDMGYSVQVTSDSGYIIAGKTKSFGFGLYDVYLIKTMPDVGIKEEKPTNGVPFTLRISPNPFTESVNIKYSIGQSAEPIELEIYDVTGRNIRALVTNGIYSGTQTVVWNGNNNAGEKVSGGIYFLKIKSGKHCAVRKLIMIR